MIEKVKVKCWFRHLKPIIAEGEISWCNGIEILTIYGCVGISAYRVIR